MAQIVAEGIQAKPRASYPWDEWLDGQARILVPGEDFWQPLENFRVYVYTVARSRGIKISTKRMPGKSLMIQARL